MSSFAKWLGRSSLIALVGSSQVGWAQSISVPVEDGVPQYYCLYDGKRYSEGSLVTMSGEVRECRFGILESRPSSRGVAWLVPRSEGASKPAPGSAHIEPAFRTKEERGIKD